MEPDRPQIGHSHPLPPPRGIVVAQQYSSATFGSFPRENFLCVFQKWYLASVFVFKKLRVCEVLQLAVPSVAHCLYTLKTLSVCFFNSVKKVLFAALSRLELRVNHIFLSPAPRNIVWRFVTLWLKAPGSNMIVVTAFYLPNPLIAMVSIFAVYHLLIQNTYVTVTFIPRMQLGVELCNKSLFYRRHSFCSV